MLINLTPHIIIFPNNIIIEPGETVARVEVKDNVSFYKGIKIIRRSYNLISGLPNPIPGTYYIVSSLVRLALPHRTDLVSPYILEKDEEGKILKANCLMINTGVFRNDRDNQSTR